MRLLRPGITRGALECVFHKLLLIWHTFNAYAIFVSKSFCTPYKGKYRALNNITNALMMSILLLLLLSHPQITDIMNIIPIWICAGRNVYLSVCLIVCLEIPWTLCAGPILYTVSQENNNNETNPPGKIYIHLVHVPPLLCSPVIPYNILHFIILLHFACIPSYLHILCLA